MPTIDTESERHTPSPLPAILDSVRTERYANGPLASATEFDFLEGLWDCAISIEAGEQPFELSARWSARFVQERRVMVDEIVGRLLDGREAFGWINLRTFAPETGWWEIVGLQALEASVPVRTIAWAEDGELHERFEVPSEQGPVPHRSRFHAIEPDAFRFEWRIGRPGQADAETPWRRFLSLRATRLSPDAAERG